jgi:hypothetical protein
MLLLPYLRSFRISQSSVSTFDLAEGNSDKMGSWLGDAVQFGSKMLYHLTNTLESTDNAPV